MSTKVYYGARCKKKDLAVVLSALHISAMKIMKERIAMIASKKRIGNFDDWNEGNDAIHGEWKTEDATPFHITVWAQVWIPDGDYVLMNLSRNLKQSDFPPELQEYGYWNNVDRLESVSAQAWRKRGDVWEKALALPEDEAGQLVFDFIRERDVWLEFYKVMNP